MGQIPQTNQKHDPYLNEIENRIGLIPMNFHMRLQASPSTSQLFFVSLEKYFLTLYHLGFKAYL